MKDQNLIIGNNHIQDNADAGREENDVLTCDKCNGYLFTPAFVLI